MGTGRHDTDRSLRKETGGAVYVEFIIAFIPFFIMVLGMIQLALMYSAHLVVQHAAAMAARAAIVVMPECEYYYDGARMNDTNGGGSGGDPSGALGGVFGGGAGSLPEGTGLPGGTGGGGGGRGGASSGGDPSSVYTGGARLDSVRFAANFPLVATSPSLDELRGDTNARNQSVLGAIGGTANPLTRLAIGALGYNNVGMAVTFPQSARSTTYRSRFGQREAVTARVTYLFHCGVPIVATMACDDALALYTGLPVEQLRQAVDTLRSGRASPADIAAAYENVNQARNRLAAGSAGINELGASRAGYTAGGILMGLTGGHFSVLRAEATLPNQGTEEAIGLPCTRSGR